MIILQHPRGNLGSMLIRAVHYHWPDQFPERGLGTWKHDNYRADLELSDPTMITPEQTTRFVELLQQPCIVNTTNTNVIPSLLVNQVPDSQKFRIDLETQEQSIKNLFCSWLGDISNQVGRAGIPAGDSIDFYQDIWRQLCVQVLETNVSTQGQSITDLSSYTGISHFMDAVKAEYSLPSSNLGTANSDQWLSETLRLSLLPIQAFANEFEAFKDIYIKILEVGHSYQDYRTVFADNTMLLGRKGNQLRFTEVMDFFCITKKDFWRFDENMHQRLPSRKTVSSATSFRTP